MNLDYLLIQYIDDQLRCEGRNIGVIAHGEGSAFYRGLGVGPDGTVDSSYFRTFSPRASENEWVYREWASWFQTLAENEGRDPEQFDAIMRELEDSGCSIVARYGGFLEIPEDEDPDQAMDSLFSQVVTVPRRPRRQGFGKRLWKVLEDSGVAARADFHRDVTVEFSPNGAVELVGFSFLLETRPRAVFKTVHFAGGRNSYVRQISDALYSFERAVANGFVSRERCFVLTENLSQERESYLDRLRLFATILDVKDPDVADKIENILRIA